MSYIQYYIFCFFHIKISLPAKNYNKDAFMKKEQYLFIEETLRELTLFIRNARIEEEKENFKNLFYVVKKETPLPMQETVARKLNKKITKNREFWTAEEIKKMPYIKNLKYRVTQKGVHQFRYRRNGYNLSFNSTNYEKAKKKAYEFIRSLKKNVCNVADVTYGKKFGYIAELWLELKAQHVCEETIRAYKSVYNNHIKSEFADKSIKSILPMHLQPYFNNLFKKYERSSEDAKTIMNGTFDYAVANRIIPSNPMVGVIVNKHFRKTGMSLNDDQIARLKDKSFNGGAIGIAALIILYTGVRGFELNSIVFDWENGTFTVNNAKLKKGQKTKEENLKRTVPIFPGIYKIKNIIIDAGNTWRFQPKVLSQKFSEFWEENTVKDLRHTFSTKTQQAGVPENIVHLWTGHLPGKTVTANVYTHFDMDYQKKHAELVNNY